MDTNIEDKMYHQIERNLSNNINDNLFSSGRMLEDKKIHDAEYVEVTSAGTAHELLDTYREGNSAGTDTINSFPQLSRAEYIRRAREACLRQMEATQVSIRSMDTYIPDGNPDEYDARRKKSRSYHLFRDGAEEDNAQDVASFRLLMIQAICAVVIFLSVFVIDKLELKVGKFSYEVVREFVTGKDYLGKLEEIVVSWLK